MLTATALFASASLVLGQPQDRRLQTRDFTDDLAFNLDASPNGVTVPFPVDFLPSTPDRGPSSPNGFPNLSFNVPGALSALPQPPARSDSFGSTGLPTDDTNTLNLYGESASDVARNVNSPPETPVTLQTEGVKQAIDAVSNGQVTYVIFGAAPNLRSIVTMSMSNDEDWNAFARDVRIVAPSYVLRSVPGEMLFIFTFQNDISFRNAETSFLYDNDGKFLRIVQDRCEKVVYGYQVHDDASLRVAIDSHSNAPPVLIPTPRVRVPGWRRKS